MNAKKVRENIIEGYKSFYLSLYGLDSHNFEKCEEFKKFSKGVDNFLKTNFENFDVEISVAYRLGEVKKSGGVTKYKSAGSICNVAERGITLPENIAWFEIYAKPVVKQESSNLVLKQSSRRSKLFDQKIGVSRDIDVETEGLDVFKVGENVKVFNLEDIKEFCQLITFKRNQEIEL